MGGQEFRHGLGVGAVRLGAQGQGLQSLENEKAVEGRRRRADVAHKAGTNLGAEGGAGRSFEFAEQIPEVGAVVTGIRSGDFREFPRGGPIETAGLDEGAADGGPVPADDLCQGIDRDVRADGEGVEDGRRGDGVVQDKGDAGGMLSLGLPPNRLTATGLADLEPLYPNTTPEYRAKNQRVDFVLERWIGE